MSGTYERKDRLYSQAKTEGFRSRAAYKLVEIDQKFSFLRPGCRVVDLGCFPGGWLQIASQKAGPRGLIIGIDLDHVEPVREYPTNAPVIVLRGDASDLEMQREMLRLSGGKVDAVISDMSPKLTGVKFSDVARSADLVELAWHIARNMLKPGGSFVAKIFPGNESDVIFRAMRKDFEKLSRHVLKASRKTSNEYYFVGRGFSGAAEVGDRTGGIDSATDVDPSGDAG